ncbi:methyltransferase domain protein [Ceratobasidium sp. AG-Ba]|nr:methyltransferase domain protein [Ceratobasidium sp. AG-Ba]
MTPLPENIGHGRISVDNIHEIIDLSQDMVFDETSDSGGAMFSDPGSSLHTMSTIQSDEVPGYFQSIYGTTFPSDENVPLVFPSDAKAEQLDVLLHTIIRLCRGGKHVPDEVDEMLRSRSAEKERPGVKVLDLTTDSGTWAKEMAEIYSTARFTSLDNKPLVPHTPHARIEFQIYDFQIGIMEPDDAFDLVHMKRGVLATKDFNLLLQEIHRVLKPDGFIMITEIPFDKYEGTDPQVPLRSAPYFAKSIEYAYNLCKTEGVDTEVWQNMSTRLDPTHPLWENERIGAPMSLDTGQGDLDIPHKRGFYKISLHKELLPSPALADTLSIPPVAAPIPNRNNAAESCIQAEWKQKERIKIADKVAWVK